MSLSLTTANPANRRCPTSMEPACRDPDKQTLAGSDFATRRLGFGGARFVALLSLTLTVGLTGCNGCDPVGVDGGVCSSEADCESGETCNSSGQCVSDDGNDAGNEPETDGGDGDGNDGGNESDGGSIIDVDGGFTPPDVIRDPNPNDIQENDNRDSDCDGISDADEFGDFWPGGRKTDPANWDSDNDGVPDGVEAGRTEIIEAECGSIPFDLDPFTKTNPTLDDFDGDCIVDGIEDRNRNGRFDEGSGETDPRSTDSDHDGIDDGAEDTNCNGVVDTGETDPANRDSDNDGLGDGVELEMGLDPTNPDSDNDGVNDGDEIANGTDPGSADLDTDFDGILDVHEATLGTNPLEADTDGDGLCDGAIAVTTAPFNCAAGEDRNANGIIDPGESDPLSPDTDCDGASDGLEVVTLTSDPLDPDTDGDSLIDGLEAGQTVSPDATCVFVADADPTTTTDPVLIDSDGDGKNDGIEDLDRDGALGPAANVAGGLQETDASSADTDGDGFCDGPLGVASVCVPGEDINADGRQNNDETDPRVSDEDTDGDGIPDARETLFGTDPLLADSDGDGLCDGPGNVLNVCVPGEDLNGNGVLDIGETRPLEADSDCDAVSDLDEVETLFTNPLRADSDGDGIRDGVELGRIATVANAVAGSVSTCTGVLLDADPTGNTNSDPLDTDTDNDGIPDGLEDRNADGALGAVGENPQETLTNNADTDGDGLCDGPGTVAGVCIAGEDLNFNGVTNPGETNPRIPDVDTDGDGLTDFFELRADTAATLPDNPDTDGDGLCDGPGTVVSVCVAGEDMNRNGVADLTETSPVEADSDCDAILDSEELTLGTNPLLVDTDGDLIHDGVEIGRIAVIGGAFGCPTARLDADASKTTNPLVRDSDGDGMNDGLEDRNRDGAVGAATGGATPQETDASLADTDVDGLCDGPGNVQNVCVSGEDRNRNGVVDANETDPRVFNGFVDDDGDGIDNNDEIGYGTDPNDPDSDDDGLDDGEEVFVTQTNPNSVDTDCDGITDPGEIALGTDPLVRDSDGDGLTDGLESGTDCLVPSQTDTTCGTLCFRDGDVGATTTDPNDADSDDDGVVDGAEDSNGDGVADDDELDPNDGNDAGGSIQDACATPVIPGQFAELLSDTLLAMAPEFAGGEQITVDGNVVGSTVVDAANGLIAFAVRMDRVDARTPIQVLDDTETLIGNTTVPITQTFTTWDGFTSARGTYDLGNTNALATRGQQVVRRIFSRAANDGTVLAPFSGAAAENGPFKLGLNVVHRSATTQVVVGVMTQLSQFQDLNAGRDFRLEDIQGGSALGQFGDDIGTQCDVFASVNDDKVDIIWVVDDSGSMNDAQDAVSAAVATMVAQLQNSTLDWRMGLVTTNYWLNDDQACDFSSTAAGFQACIDGVPASGRGDERGWESLQKKLSEHSDPNERWLPAVAGRTDRVRPDARLVIIALSDAGDQSRRADGTSADATNNRPSDNDIAGWSAFFNGAASQNAGGTDVSWDPIRTDEPPAIMGSIICPESAAASGGCSGEEDSTGDGATNDSLQTYADVTANLGGIRGAISQADGSGPDCSVLTNPECVAFRNAISTTITGIVNNIISVAAPYELSNAPIASTIKVALEGPVQNAGNCDITNVPRSRASGFSYDAAVNRIAFFGDCRPTANDADIAVSYRTWIDLTGDPDGNDPPCVCDDPFICVDDICVCPSDCGLPGGLADNQTCNPSTCSPECLEDCGGCASGQICDTSPGVCACSCPADCGDPNPPPGFTCNQGTCEFECNACPGTRPSANSTCDFQLCQWDCTDGCGAGDPPPGQFCNNNSEICDFECLADCGGCGENQQCNIGTCQCECPADCGGTPPGPGYQCNASTCQYECDAVPDEQTRPGDNFVWDALICDWTCPADCGTDAPGDGYQCDSASCEYVCPADCGGCDGALTCNSDTCGCECPADCGGPAPSANHTCNQATCQYQCTDSPDVSTRPAPNFLWDQIACAWVCPGTCGEPTAPTAPYQCDPTTCSATCQLDCGGICGDNESCDTDSCGCVCDQSTTCEEGLVFDEDACGCVCDTTQECVDDNGSDCSDTHELDPENCSWICQDDCGGCPGGFFCQSSLCECVSIGG